MTEIKELERIIWDTPLSESGIREPKDIAKALSQYVIKARIETALKCRHFVSERYLLEWDEYIAQLKKGTHD